MKKIFILLTISILANSIVAQEQELKEAENAYKSEQYDKAIEIYETVLRNYGDSYELYYNLGNSFYKRGRIADAILNYERALLIKPDDEEVRINLELVKQQTVDKIEPIEEILPARIFRLAQNSLSVDSWATVGIVGFVLLILCLTSYFFAKWMKLRKLGFYLGIILLIIVISANIFGYNQKHDLQNRNGAIVFAPTVTVKGSPDQSGTDLFVLHEGTKVFIRSTVGDWHEIALEDGNVGWLNKSDIKGI
jgi:tetratricopeptide (TPR) repeat protein